MRKKGNITNWLYWFSLALAVIGVYKFLDNFTQIGEFLSNLLGILMQLFLYQALLQSLKLKLLENMAQKFVW